MESRHYWCRRIIIYSTQNLPTATHIYSQIQFFFCFENSGSSCCLVQLSFLYWFHFEAILSKYAFQFFFTAAVKVEVFSTRLTASPEFVNCGGEKFCTHHFLLWQGDVKWPLRSASALTWYHTSYGRLPQQLPFFLCPFFTQSSWPCHSSLLSIVIKPSKTQGSWFLMMMGLVMTLKLMILYRPMSGKVSSGGHCVLHYCRPVLHWSFPGQ